jgi:hypothetical protein
MLERRTAKYAKYAKEERRKKKEHPRINDMDQ